MALKNIKLEISNLTAGLLHDAETRLQSDRAGVLVQNEQLQKRNAELEAKLAVLQQTLEMQMPIVQNAMKLPELLETLKSREEEAAVLRQKLQQLQSVLTDLQQQLKAKEAKCREPEQAAKPASEPAAKPEQAARASRPSAGVGRREPQQARRTLSAYRSSQKDSTRILRLGTGMGRVIFLHKLFGEMALPPMEPESFCYLADCTKGFSPDMFRLLVKDIRENAKCQPEDFSTEDALDECVRNVQNLFRRLSGKLSTMKHHDKE